MGRTEIRDTSIEQLSEMVSDMGHRSFRVGQILKWIYQKRVDHFEQMRNVSRTFREQLEERFGLSKLPVEYLLESDSGDAAKFGFGIEGGVVESA